MGSRAFCKLILRKDRSVNFTRLLTRPPLKGMGCRFDEGFMNQLVAIERFFLIGHIAAMVFGLFGLLIIVPNPDLIMSLPPYGQTLFQAGMTSGGVVYILLGTVAVSIYAYRTLGLQPWLTFMLPAVFISLSSELLGTSTGFPFGHYSYLNGLGYKIAGLVPYTIPLSWFYLGFVAYLLARAGLAQSQLPKWLPTSVVAIALGALLLTSWDFVLDPAMSQALVPFWYWHQAGAFFGMPYQNFAGWMGTGAVFMSVAAFFWRKAQTPLQVTQAQLALPLTIYLSNFAFAAITSIAAGIVIPVLLGLVLGVAPAIALWWFAKPTNTDSESSEFLPANPIPTK